MAIDDGIDRPRGLDPYATRAYPGREEATHTSWVTARTEHYLELRAADRRPSCCISGYNNPHSPLIAPQRFLDLYRGRAIAPWSFPPEREAERLAAGITDERLVQAKVGYYAMVSEVDEAVGQLGRTLDRLGLTDDTLVAFRSDHGEFLGEQLRWGKGYPAPDCVTRVPLIFAGPGVEGGGRDVDRVAEAVDLIPTVLDAFGRTRPPLLEGTSRWAELQGLDSPGDDGFALTEDTAWKALRTPGHRYILHRDGREELFDVRAPFGECRDISADAGATQVLARLRHHLLTRLFAKERALPRAWPY
jgi:choline-sulfatase